MHEIKELFMMLPFVARVCVFGSLARDEWDRWSDIDMIVVTANQSDFRKVHQHLSQHKSIFHHSGFMMPIGWCVLGNVFEGESIFHCLDLNFMTLSEYQTEGTLTRFGHISELYSATIDSVKDDISPTADAENAQNAENTRIYEAVHFTKKAAKKLLRKTGTVEELQRCLAQLKFTMRDYPENFTVPSGAIGRLAQNYIDIAERLLGDQHAEH
jgi:hypothetical protein